MNKQTPIPGSVNEKGMFTAKNPYLSHGESYDIFNKQHPQLLTYTPSNVLVTDEEHVEVVGPVWQIQHTKGWSTIKGKEIGMYTNTNSVTRQVYITIPPTEKATNIPSPISHEFWLTLPANERDLYSGLTRICDNEEWVNVHYDKPFKAVDEPEAQPLEGVKTENENASKEFKTIEQLMVELQDKMHYDTYPSDEQPPIYKIEYLTGDYFPLHMVKKVCEAYHAQFATDAGGGTESEIKEIIFTIGEISLERRLEIYNKLKATLSAPSTHSSSEMVEKDKLIKDLQRQLKTQVNHKDSLKQYWLSCAESKKKWHEAIKEYFDSEHPEGIQSFDEFKEQFDLED